MASPVLPGTFLYPYQLFRTLKSVVAAFIVFHSFPKVNNTASGVAPVWGSRRLICQSNSQSYRDFGSADQIPVHGTSSPQTEIITWNRLMRAQQNQSPVCHKNLSACARTRVMWYLQNCIYA